MQRARCDHPSPLQLIIITPRSYVAYAENYTLSMTHGFTIKAPSVNAPQYFDLTGTWGRIVYTDDSDRQIAFDPCAAT
jgi:hypothetical protein